MLLMKAREKRGAALIVALLVTFVVMMLSTLVIQQAINNTDAAGYNRSRRTSVNAAEAGLDYYDNYLGNTIDSLTATRTFYDAEGDPYDIGTTFSATIYPRSVKTVSVGTTNGETDRTMETFMQLTPIFGGLTGAVVTNSSTTWTNNFTLSATAATTPMSM
jgi:Tfp pilus assembly protein PilX